MANQTPQNGRSQRRATEIGAATRGDREATTERVRGLVTIAVFIAVSLVAVRNLGSYHAIPQRIRSTLGTPPSTTLISAFLIVYSFSAILITLSRMTTGSERHGGLAHVGYLTAFYAFYFFADSLAENFWAVFAAGLTVLGLEAYQLWTWCSEEIRREAESPGGGDGDA
jgi:hypothetical protein